MEVFYANYVFWGKNPTSEEIMVQQDKAAYFADRVRIVGYVINITETNNKDSFRVVVWYSAPYKLETD